MELEHDPERWIPVFGKDHAPTKKLERDDDSKRSHHALGVDQFIANLKFGNWEERLDLAWFREGDSEIAFQSGIKKIKTDVGLHTSH